MPIEDFPDLNERASHILKVLVESYIQEGQPVGSRKLAQQSGLDLSPATIRNVMSDLEDMGYIVAPHKSAGRVPTSLGYRLFVNQMVSVEPLEEQAIQHLQSEFQVHHDAQSLIQSATNLLSGVTQLAGIIRVPKLDSLSIKQIDFVRLSAKRILVVMVMEHNEIQNRIIQVEHDLSASELQQATNFLNEILVGKDLYQAKQYLIDAMKKDHAEMNQMMLAAIQLGERALLLDDVKQDECLIAGKSNLIAYDELADMDKLRQLFTAFNQKRDVLNLLDQCMKADGVKIFIGSESGYSVFDDCSVVTAPYTVNSKQLGVIGVIGPKRMHYERVIPAVDVTARLLSAALKK